MTFTYKSNVEVPKDLVLLSTVYVHPEIVKTLDDKFNAHNIFCSNANPGLYTFSPSDECIRVDTEFQFN